MRENNVLKASALHAHPLFHIDPRYPWVDVAEQLVGDCAADVGCLKSIHSTFFFPEQYDLVIRLDTIRIAPQIHHELIHADSTGQRIALTVYPYPALVGEKPVVAVRISCTDNCDCGIFLSLPCESVGDFLPFPYILYLKHMGNKIHHRL